jgi:hypothetical protein
MKNMMSKARRIMALALVLAMTLTTLGGYAPGWFSAFAEEAVVEQPQDNSADWNWYLLNHLFSLLSDKILKNRFTHREALYVSSGIRHGSGS